MVKPDSVSNTCSLCGKQRIVVSETEELIGNSLVTSREMRCEDPLCQKKLDKQLEQERAKREANKLNKTTGFSFRNKQPNTS